MEKGRRRAMRDGKGARSGGMYLISSYKNGVICVDFCIRLFLPYRVALAHVSSFHNEWRFPTGLALHFARMCLLGIRDDEKRVWVAMCIQWRRCIVFPHSPCFLDHLQLPAAEDGAGLGWWEARQRFAPSRVVELVDSSMRLAPRPLLPSSRRAYTQPRC